MFFGRKKAIQGDARNIAEWVIKFKKDLFEGDDMNDFIKRLHRYQIKESYRDERRKEFGWFLKEDPRLRFPFHAEFDSSVLWPRYLTVEAKEEYFGVVIISFSADMDINVKMNRSKVVQIGPKAEAFQQALLSFPNFSNPGDLLKGLLGG